MPDGEEEGERAPRPHACLSYGAARKDVGLGACACHRVNDAVVVLALRLRSALDAEVLLGCDAFFRDGGHPRHFTPTPASPIMRATRWRRRFSDNSSTRSLSTSSSPRRRKKGISSRKPSGR